MTAIHRSHSLLAAAGFIASLTLAANAWGQQETIYIGGASPRGSVVVDTSVLDSLGSDGGFGRQTLNPPAPRGAVDQHITLKPPGQKSAATPKPRTTTKAQPVTPRKAPAPTTKTAAAKPPAAPVAAPPSPPVPAMAEMPPPPPAPNDIAMPPTPQTPDPKPLVVAATKAPPASVEAPPPPAAAPRESKPAPAVAPVAVVNEPPPAPPTPEAVPVAAPAKPVAPPATPQVASVPAPQANSGSGKPSMRIPFAGDGAALPEPAKGELKQIATALGQDPALRVQVMAYANGGDDASKARRLSLSRALAVRTYLIEQGVGSTRIDVRALGNAPEGGPSDRVDLMMLSR